MFDIATTGPTPEDLATRMVFEKVRVPITHLAEALDLKGEVLRGRRFVDCVVHGPAVVVPGDETRFNGCNLGDVAGDVKNLFLRTTGPRIIGAVGLNDCVFEGCLVIGVGFAGTDEYVAAMLKSLSPNEA